MDQRLAVQQAQHQQAASDQRVVNNGAGAGDAFDNQASQDGQPQAQRENDQSQVNMNQPQIDFNDPSDTSSSDLQNAQRDLQNPLNSAQ
jgi:hypothetical protein